MNRVFAPLFFVAMLPLPAATLTVQVSGASGGEGPVKVALWKDPDKFLKGKSYKIVTVQHKDGTAVAVFEGVEPGEYAVSAYNDKNGNGRLDTGFMGKPSEPYGFSNDSRHTFGPAKFQEAKIQLDEPGRIIAIRLK